MHTIETRITLLSPAFLGNAEQNGQWRTPPIKALLRQWWRVVYAAQRNFSVSVQKMRHDEGMLFGHAWLDDDNYERDGRSVKAAGRRSLVRIRLNHWHLGTLRKEQWAHLETLAHPEVSHRMGADLYMGFGPVTLPRGASKPELKAKAALQAGESAQLSLAFPESVSRDMETVLWLLNRYGAFGGRSRNGWGSLSLAEAPAIPPPSIFRPWQDCLSEHWPHAIGQDQNGPLVWETPPCEDWKDVMVQMARIKIALRTHFPFCSGKDAEKPDKRHWLAYPVTNHSVKKWRNLRLPNMLHFRIRPGVDGKLVGVAYLMPYLPPKEFHPDPKELASLWSEVLRFLDQSPTTLHRVPA